MPQLTSTQKLNTGFYLLPGWRNVQQYIAFISLYFLLSTKLVVAQTSGYITTYAGNGIAAYLGDSVLATVAELNGPAGLAVDDSNNLYIADYGNNMIRMVNYTTGIITTIAGNGAYSPDSGIYAGDGGLATAASLYNPSGIALDKAGNIYICDQSNNRIREIIKSSGIIITIAGNGTGSYSGDGGLATLATLKYPSELAFDTSGDLYIADWGNSVIRKLSMSTGIINTIAGNGIPGYSGDGLSATSANLAAPSGLVFDKANNLYLSDWGNSTVRKIDGSTGIITTVAGTGTPGISADGIAATSAALYKPLGLTLDTAGNIYICDWYESSRIRIVNAATGIINTIAGNGTEGYYGDGGPATMAELNGSDGIAIDKLGNLYIADEFNAVIREVYTIYTTGIANLPSNPKIVTLFPDPAKDYITINAGTIPLLTRYNIINSIGQVILTGSVTPAISNIDLRGITPGLYFMQTVNNEGNEIIKFSKE